MFDSRFCAIDPHISFLLLAVSFSATVPHTTGKKKNSKRRMEHKEERAPASAHEEKEASRRDSERCHRWISVGLTVVAALLTLCAWAGHFSPYAEEALPRAPSATNRTLAFSLLLQQSLGLNASVRATSVSYWLENLRVCSAETCSGWFVRDPACAALDPCSDHGAMLSHLTLALAVLTSLVLVCLCVYSVHLPPACLRFAGGLFGALLCLVVSACALVVTATWRLCALAEWTSGWGLSATFFLTIWSTTVAIARLVAAAVALFSRGPHESDRAVGGYRSLV